MYGEVGSVICGDSLETTLLALVTRESRLISTEAKLARCLSNELIYRIFNGLAVLENRLAEERLQSGLLRDLKTLAENHEKV